MLYGPYRDALHWIDTHSSVVAATIYLLCDAVLYILAAAESYIEILMLRVTIYRFLYILCAYQRLLGGGITLLVLLAGHHSSGMM